MMDKHTIQKNKNKGFTLVEMIVTLVLVGILAGAAAMGLASYSKYAAYKRNNEYAQSVFAAAQSGLTHYKASGQLEDLKDVIDVTGSYLDDTVTYKVDTNDVSPSDYASRLAYLTIDKATGVESAGVSKELYDLLKDYIYDDSIFDASIRVEFDPVDGTVFSVLYSDKADSFTITGTAGSVSRGVMNICDRTETTRKDIILGYYSSALSNQAPSSKVKPVVSAVALTNSDTLDLQWNMSNKYKNITNVLSYHVFLYQEGISGTEDALVASFDVNTNNEDRIISGSQGSATVNTAVTLYGADNTALAPKNCKFLAYAENNILHMTLDAIDLDAAAATSNYDNTYSIKRLGVSTSRKIYVRVQAYGSNYKASAFKRSKSEQPYYASVDTTAGTEYTFGIGNARHLYNVRFREETATDSTKDTYTQKAEIVWGGSKGIIAKGYVYKGQNSVAKTYTTAAFPAITKLKQSSTYESTQNKGQYYAITNLNLTPKTDKQELTDAEKQGRTEEELRDEKDSLGLFCVNEGTIQKVRLTDSVIDGTSTDKKTVNNCVGNVCGINRGSLTDITVQNASVTGNTYVGGIAGKDESIKDKTDGTRVYEKLTYSGIINGEKYIGGILGYNTDSTIENCTVSLNDEIETAYKNGTETIQSLIANLHGDYVGGIVGYSAGGAVQNCATNGGSVLGANYVGGIAGGQANTILGDAAKEQKNQANVLANQYAGGIVGENIAGSTIAGWTNTGIVMATTAYGGGITGHNEGTIENCNSIVDTSAVSGTELVNMASAFGATGDYIGGIVGMNAGTIENTSVQATTSVVAGHNYIGGITGYNEQDAVITNANVDGGYIQGNCYVSGFIGLNASEKIFGEASGIVSSPNSVNGAYYVGGIMGANLVATGSDLSLGCDTNNFLGSIHASGAVAGGFVGYNELLGAGTTNEQILARSEELLPEVQEGEAVDSAAVVARLVKKLASGTTKENTTSVLRIGAIKSDSAVSNGNKLNNIQSQVMAGGVIGFNALDTGLYVTGISNKATIVATSAVEDQDGQIHGYGTVAYSYSGGILGYATQHVTIDNCKNEDAGEIQATRATYRGGLVELNEGTIQNCDAGSITEQSWSHIGGIAGINGLRDNQDGLIENCTLSGSIMGSSYIGGIASENYGKIYDIEINGAVQGVGTYVGGIVGMNHASGVITKGVLNKNVTGSGTYVGGFVGGNAGLLYEATMGNNIRVQGQSYVGGFIGIQEAGASDKTVTISDLDNSAEVTASKSYAGGIVGGVAEDATFYQIKNCTNTGKVSAQGNDGYAGGILANNAKNGGVYNCQDYANVEATNGVLGGVAAQNSGIIQECTVGDGKNTLTFQGNRLVGGLCASNSGTIRDSAVQNINVKNTNTSTAGHLGGLVGDNTGLISFTKNQTMKNLTVQTQVDGCSLGGVAGRNTSQITANDGITNTVYASIGFTGVSSAAIDGNLGGIAGENTSKITGQNFAGEVSGNSNSSMGYGGIAGVNGTMEASRATNAALIARCAVVKNGSNNTIIKGQGTSSSLIQLGGIAGVNYLDGKITTSSVSDTDISAYAGYVGGAAGHNYGEIAGCDNKDTGAVTLTITGNSNKVGGGNIGGLVGQNEVNGKVNTSSTGKTWKIAALANFTDNATGGCIGYSLTGESMHDLVNYASVSKTVTGSNSVGGIVGRQENPSSNGWSIVDCANYGALNGLSRVGGIVGQMKYYSGYISGCDNYGRITSSSLGSGIAAYAYVQKSGNVVSISNCRNFGYVGGGQSGGIFGGISESSGLKINISDCVNLGLIGGSASGICGTVSGATCTLTRCRNYGTTNSSTNAAGITLNSATLVGCFGIADMPVPIANTVSSSSRDNYYFGEVVESDTNIGFDKGQITVTGKGSNGTNEGPDKLCDGDQGTRWSYNAGGNNRLDPTTVTIPYLKAAETKQIQIYWYVNSSDTSRQYEFDLYYTREDGTEVWVAPEGTNKYTVQGKAYTPTDNCYTYTFDTPVKLKGIRIVLHSAYRLPNQTNQYAAINEVICTNTDASALQTYAAGTSTESKTGSALEIKKQEDGTYTAENTSVEITGLPVNPQSKDYQNMVEDYSARKLLYDAIDDKLVASYIRTFGTVKLSAPENLTMTNQGSEYTTTWKQNDNAYATRLMIQVYDSKESSDAVDTWTRDVGTGNTATIPILDEWRGKYIKFSAQFISAKEENSSDISYYSSGNRIYVPNLLATPQVEFRLESAASQGYRVVLLNPEDYKDGNYVITVLKGTTKIASFSSEAGQSSSLVASPDTSGTFVLTASAASEDGTRISASSNRQTTCFTPTSLPSSTYTTIKLEKLKGVTDDTLTYDLRVKSDKEIYYRAELITDDDVLGTKTIVRSANVRASSTSSSDGDLITLSNLPTDLSGKILVRSYLEYSQNAVTRYAYVIAENLSATSLDELKENLSAQYPNLLTKYPTILTQLGSIDDSGPFEIEKNDDGTYNIWYNLMLENSGMRTKQIHDNIIDLDTMLLPAPVIDTTNPQQTGSETYSFQWDQDVTGSDQMSYAYTLTGYTSLDESSEGVLLDSNSAYVGNSLDVTGSGWRYVRLALHVTRLGTADTNGYTKTIGQSSDYEWNVKIPLSTIAMPSAPQLNAETGKDELRYDVSWSGLTNSEEMDALQAYEVYIRKENETTRTKVETLSPDEDGDIPTSVTLDLDEYSGRIYISIKAIAKTDSVTYVDSEDGVERAFSMPDRLATPDITQIAENPIYDEAGFVTMLEFKNSGVTVRMPNADLSVNMILQAAVYDAPDVDADGNPTGNLLETLAGDFGGDVWNPITMSNDGTAAAYSFTGLSDEYPGQYLFLKFRNTSESNISSVWSDLTCIRLTRAQLETLDLTEGKQILKHSGTMTNAEGVSLSADIQVTQDYLFWSEDAYANAYTISLKKLADSASYDIKLKKTDTGYAVEMPGVDENNQPITVEQKLTNQSTAADDTANQVRYAVDLNDYTVTYTGAAESGYTYEVEVPARLEVVEELSEDKTEVLHRTYSVVLPDAEQLYGYTYLRTSYVLVQSVATDADRYEDSLQKEWVRYLEDPADKKTGKTLLREMEDDLGPLQNKTGETYAFLTENVDLLEDDES